MQQIYGCNVFPVVYDQIRYYGETNPPTLGIWLPGQPKTRKSAIRSNFLILMNPQSSALSVEREDMIKGHVQML